MKIAIPVAQGKLCAHFGHCETFAMLTIDDATRKVTATESLVPPPHEPGVLPRWVGEQGANLVLAGGMGGRAIQLFQQAGVDVVTGCPSEDPQVLVEQYLAEILETGANSCGHDENHNCNH